MAAVFFATLKEYEMQQTWRDSEDRRPAAPPECLQAEFRDPPRCSEDKLTFIVLDRSLPADPALGLEGREGAVVGDVNVFFSQAYGPQKGIQVSDAVL